MNNKRWAANPHQFGPGKVHIIDDKDGAKTLCGCMLVATPGHRSEKLPDCKKCLKYFEDRPQRERQAEEYRREYEARKAAEDAAREQQNREWWASYNAYLRTPEWGKRRKLVFKRAGNVCEGCHERPASQIHHTTYAHVGNEPLWELRAVCHECHELITKLDREARGE